MIDVAFLNRLLASLIIVAYEYEYTSGWICKTGVQ